MFIVSKRNIEICSLDGKVKHYIPKGYVGDVPDWVAKTVYFNELVADGKISISATKKEKDVTAAMEEPVIDNSRKKKKTEKTVKVSY